MVPFAGWEMPIQFDGVIAEHTWCRTNAGLFDVSHMAVIELRGEDPARSLERITPAGITTLAEGRQRYGLLTNDDGGIIDDFIVTNWGEHLTMVANASRRDVDLAYLTERLEDVDVIEMPQIALIALQGPEAAEVLLGYDPALAETVFLDNRMSEIDGIQVAAGRSGYTGEDGFELAVANQDADRLARLLLENPSVSPVGLGARDTLRLEAGLCLYGNDLDEGTSPVEADLVWTMPKRRREAGDFAGAGRIQHELANGTNRVRVGVQPQGRRPVRQDAALRLPSQEDSPPQQAGSVSSGGFGPTVDRPVAMGYVKPALSEPGTSLVADVRGKDVPCTVAALPFVPHRYRRSN
jgi:aminomethyltransferase